MLVLITLETSKVDFFVADQGAIEIAGSAQLCTAVDGKNLGPTYATCIKKYRSFWHFLEHKLASTCFGLLSDQLNQKHLRLIGLAMAALDDSQCWG